MRCLALLAAALLGGCATTGAPGRGDARLVGTWLVLSNEIEFPLACASGLPITYNGDRTYDLFEAYGTWRLDGDRLTETPTGATEVEDPAEIPIGVPFISRIEWRGPDTIVKTLADGTVETLRRCPAER